MRLNSNDMNAIKECINSLDKSAEVYLFGSRTVDVAKGGDIDLLIISKEFACEVLELTPYLLDCTEKIRAYCKKRNYVSGI